ncbi:MAG: hypothetical protein M0P59_01310 [Gallionella sp.]|jgi:hypothetical protein|nr:hypothetical protein [Gallionella sp.]MCK9352780.1 hypothetical protein [Gallionella sp.]
MNAKNAVLQAITETQDEYTAAPGDSYLQGRVSGLLSAALLGDLISSEEHGALCAQSREIGLAYSHQIELASAP